MQLTLMTVGSRGDVQPILALGLGLKAAGHDVRLATHGIYREFVQSFGLDFYAIEGDPQAMLQGETGQRMVATGSNPLTMMRHFSKLMDEMLQRLIPDALEASRDAEALIYTPSAYFAALPVAEKLGLPLIAAGLQPTIVPTRAYPNAFFPLLPGHIRIAHALYNRASYAIMMRLFWQLMKGPFNRARRDALGLPPVSYGRFKYTDKAGIPVLYAFSPLLVPPAADWPDSVHTTGFWFLDQAAGWQPPADLLAFLEAGPAPIYLGFGSMSTRDQVATTALLLDAVAKSGQRVVLASGWAELSAADLPVNLFRIDAAPHDWLFPRMAAVVHHAGAGTTAAGLRAGVPTICVPFFADQPFWASRVHALGVGPKPIPRRQLSADRLAAAIRAAVTDAGMRERARAVGEQIRAEQGVANAVALVERHLRARLPGS